jgi:hypothetical protein
MISVEQEWDGHGRPILFRIRRCEWLSAHERELVAAQRERRANRQHGQQEWLEADARILRENEPPNSPKSTTYPHPDPEGSRSSLKMYLRVGSR